MLTIEPTRIANSCDWAVVTIDDHNQLMVFNGRVDRCESAQLATALQHFAAHGTFCPEPEPPIEWTELEPWLWHTKGAAIAMSGNGICVAVVAGKRSCSDFATLADAKSYAESQIRKGMA